MEPNQMITVGLVPSQQLVSLLTDDEGNWRDVPEVDGQSQTVVPLVKIEKPAQGTWEPNVVWFADRVERQWIAGTPVPLPLVTAEEHLRSVGLAGDRQPTLLYLRQSLTAAGKTCAELDAVEAYLQQILTMFAANPAPQASWPNPPLTFEAAVQAAMNALNS